MGVLVGVGLVGGLEVGVSGLTWGGVFTADRGRFDFGRGFGVAEAEPVLLIVGGELVIVRESGLTLAEGPDGGWGRGGMEVGGSGEGWVVVVGRAFAFGSGLIDGGDDGEVVGGVVRIWVAAISAGVV